MQRSETRRSQIEGMMALFAKADALNMEQVEKVFDGIDDLDAVVSTIGGTVAEPLADSQGNINIIEAAKKRGVKKFVLVTSIGAGDSKDATPPSVYVSWVEPCSHTVPNSARPVTDAVPSRGKQSVSRCHAATPSPEPCSPTQ